MTFEMIRNIFAWCTTINIALLIIWSLIYLLAHDWYYNLYNKIYRTSLDTFIAINCGGLTIYSLLIMVFNLIPYLSMHIVS